MRLPTLSLLTLTALALAASLTACGGGGGNSAPAPAPAPGTGGTTTDVVVSTGTLFTTVTAPTYTAGGQRAVAYSDLNAARLGAGAGTVQQSAELDTAASAHANYLTVTRTVTHDEDPDNAAVFYATNVGARVSKAGFDASYATEVIGGTGASHQITDCVVGLLNTVYHAAASLSYATHIGIGQGTDSAGTPMCVVNYAAAETNPYGQVPAAGSVIAYPYNGRTNVPTTFFVAYEVPRPSAVLLPNLTSGPPVIVGLRNADYLNFWAAGALDVTVSKFELKDASGNVVPSVVLGAAGVKGAGVTVNADSNLYTGFVSLVPLSPLAANQNYTYTFTATLKSGGTPVTKTVTFTTGA